MGSGGAGCAAICSGIRRPEQILVQHTLVRVDDVFRPVLSSAAGHGQDLQDGVDPGTHIGIGRIRSRKYPVSLGEFMFDHYGPREKGGADTPPFRFS